MGFGARPSRAQEGAIAKRRAEGKLVSQLKIEGADFGRMIYCEVRLT